MPGTCKLWASQEGMKHFLTYDLFKTMALKLSSHVYAMQVMGIFLL